MLTLLRCKPVVGHVVHHNVCLYRRIPAIMVGFLMKIIASFKKVR